MNGISKKGFNLLELMIVISIFGLVLAMSVPGFARFMRTWKLNGETEQMGGALRIARSAAVMKNIDVLFQFDTVAGTYFYFEDDDSDGVKDVTEYQSATTTFPAGVSISAHTLTNPMLTFGPRGNCNESGIITLSNMNAIKTITIFGGTGNVRVD